MHARMCVCVCVCVCMCVHVYMNREVSGEDFMEMEMEMVGWLCKHKKEEVCWGWNWQRWWQALPARGPHQTHRFLREKSTCVHEEPRGTLPALDKALMLGSLGSREIRAKLSLVWIYQWLYKATEHEDLRRGLCPSICGDW